MMISLFFLGSLFLVSNNNLGNNFCTDRQIKEVIQGFTDMDIDRFRKAIALLTQKPVEAAICLISELHIIQATKITPQEFYNHKEALHVIWCIRALRYLTGGLDFTGSTKYRFKKSEKDRKYFLTINGNTKIPFFGVWMSRDVIYIAPQDTQKEIIEKWKKWYFISGKTFEYNPVEDIDKWYF